MDKGVILTFLEKVGHGISNIYYASYFENLILKLGSFIKKGLNNSIIVSKLLRYNKYFGENSLLNKIIKLLYRGILCIFNHIRVFLNKPVSNSYLNEIINKAHSLYFFDLLRIVFIGLGTGILTFVVLSLVFGGLSGNEFLVGLLLVLALWFLGFFKLDLDNVMSNSHFIKMVRNFFDYNS